ncbi:hypothetical protein HRJ34_14860 [Rhizorhabdus wittichii]|uniref:Uncharacterized protein n=1 Tax=Rhizorhabdus wittichii TaxID=160791 RepID=A0A975CZ28_9SPHN|nr:hypothetical protein [Rhizorhabdus wittichii]QTH19654.1 hypothetical protein HRJ34_14860 [Rhizorhabdus wittichii]
MAGSRFASLRSGARAGNGDSESSDLALAAAAGATAALAMAGVGQQGSDDVDDDDDEPKPPKAKKKEARQEGSSEAREDQPAPLAADRVAAIRAEERQRVADVFASEHVAGRETAAAELLANSDMSAEKIVAMLPKLGANAKGGADDMLEQMQGNNPDLSPGGGQGSGNAKGGWGKITAKIAGQRQR